MDYSARILACESVADLENLLSQELKSAENDNNQQIVIANTFCHDLRKLISNKTISFPSGGVEYIPFSGASVPFYRPNTVIRINRT